MKAFECGVLIDGITDEPITDAIILVEGEIIEEIGPRDSISIPDDVEVIDHSDEVIIPGLIDTHLHLTGKHTSDQFEILTTGTIESTARATSDCRRLLDAGFTTVRDAGGRTALGLKEAINSGDIPGPRIFSSGPPISQTAGHMDNHSLPLEWQELNSPHHSTGLIDSHIADGADECRKAARKNIREGVDLIKIATTGGVSSEKDHPEQQQFTDAEIAAITEEAHRVGIDVAAHAQGVDGVKSALRNGVDTIEHGCYLDDEAVELMLENNATLVPTLAVAYNVVNLGEENDLPQHILRKAREVHEAHTESTRMAYEAGVPVANATDFTGGDISRHGTNNTTEAQLFVEEVGMTEMEAIKAATSVAARTIPDDHIGSLEPGNYADFVALNSDPLTDITSLRDTDTVYKGGCTPEKSAPLYREE